MNKTIEPEKRTQEFKQYRALLFSIAYRMTGSASDAEDLVQETYLRYQASAEQEILSVKAYLCTIVTRLALDYLKSARVTREQYIGDWLPEPILTEEEGEVATKKLEQQEELSLAFLRLLEQLTPPERAVFVLHELFDYTFPEIGSMLESSPSNCRQIFHRAQQALHDKRSRFTSQAERQRELLARFLAASQAGDMAGLTALLARDVVSWSDGGGKVQTNLKAIHGQNAVARFWSFWLNASRENQIPLTVTLAHVNGSPAILFWDGERLGIVIGLTLSEEGIQEIDAQLNPEKLGYLQRQISGAARRNSIES